MDLGRIVYRVQATEKCRVPVVNGKLLHGAVFKLLKSQSEGLATELHNALQVKPFTVAPLHINQGEQTEDISHYSVQQGECAEISITAFSEDVLHIFLNVPEGYVFQIGKANFELQSVFKATSEHPEAVLLTKKEFMDSMPPKVPELVTLRYVSPTTFRLDTSDYPFPEPRMVWGSLAMKWNQFDMPEPLDVAECKAMAEKVVPWKWKGNTERLRYNKNIAVTGFVGEFTYSLYNLDDEQKKIFYRLAYFAQFAGVGRMTAQGMGQTRLCSVAEGL
ncbi:CRISPR repeat RNA endoribonuclease Cas6 [Anaerovibrio sp. JC8]|uniref:CRISPR-associated endoribonuclease Cas6 n=1 Tax=Anaerovibrio sp. JC8 TaxID=1240085 RepID=UPI000A0DCBAC|nr:CRISPR-associated endoribonuclease Cas6 [Anaerovibrio sp. JC8]ORU00261.1 CRISPR repeat RNA endoribonuclease Cas6 [Anaerovibrio sp. JC8]